jgi:hypothetical protein
MPDRIRSIYERGKEILLVDVSNCRPSEVDAVAQTIPSHVCMKARGSVLLLVDFSGASLDAEAIRTMKESAVFDKPYIKKSTWIGAEDFPPEFYAEITSYARRDMPIFNSRERALDWLLQD